MSVQDAIGNPLTLYKSGGQSGAGTTPIGLLYQVTDPLGHIQATYTYDSNGYVSQVTDANSNPTYTNYSVLGWLNYTTDALSHTTNYTYDNWGRPIIVTAPDGTVSYTWLDANGNVVSASDASSAYGAVQAGAAWSSTVPTGFGGASASFSGATNSYIDTGTHQSPVADSSQSFSVSLWARPTVTGQNLVPCAQQFKVQFTSANKIQFAMPSTIVNSTVTYAANTWYHIVGVYDQSAQKIYLYVNGSLQGSTSFTSPTAPTTNLLIGCQTAGSGMFKGQVDELRIYNRALSASDVSTLYAYNPNNASSQPVSNGLSHYWPFNQGDTTPIFGQALAVDRCHTVTNWFDADNRLIETMNGRGDIVTYTYDGSDPRGNGRTQKGLLSSKTDGNGHNTVYGYTVRSEPEYTAYADGTTESVTYDADGNKHTHTDADGNTITYTYDPAGRLTNVTYPASPLAGIIATANVTFGYDGANRRISMVDGTGTSYWFYDRDNRVTGITSPEIGGTSTTPALNYVIDTVGRRYQMSLSGQGTWQYGYDNANRLTSVISPYADGTNFTTALGYNNDNTLSTRTAQNGAVSTYSYDAADQLTGIVTMSGTTTVQSSAYTYDDGGNVTSKRLWGGGPTAPFIYYQYDGADELTMDSMPTTTPAYPNAYTYRYSYDHNGNRLTKDWGAGTVDNYTYGGHDQLAGAGPYTFSYNTNGDTTAVYNMGALQWTYSYDCEDRLLTAQAAGGGHDDSGYDGIGTRTYVHDYAGSYNYRTDGIGPTAPLIYDGLTRYTPGLNENYAGTTSRYYEPDNMGSSLGVMNTSASQIYSLEYDAFGNQVGSSGSLGSSYAFLDAFAGALGYQTDRDDGLIHCGNRFYNPYFGRWLTQDPAANGDNWYAYCGNMPTSCLDPSGLFIETDPFTPTPDALSPNSPMLDSGDGGDEPGQPMSSESWAMRRAEIIDANLASFEVWMLSLPPAGAIEENASKSTPSPSKVATAIKKVAGASPVITKGDVAAIVVGTVVGVLISSAIDIGSEGALVGTNAAIVNGSVGFVTGFVAGYVKAQVDGGNPWTQGLEVGGLGAVGSVMTGGLYNGPVGKILTGTTKNFFYKP